MYAQEPQAPPPPVQLTDKAGTPKPPQNAFQALRDQQPPSPLGSFMDHPEQAITAGVDLVKHGAQWAKEHPREAGRIAVELAMMTGGAMLAPRWLFRLQPRDSQRWSLVSQICCRRLAVQVSAEPSARWPAKPSIHPAAPSAPSSVPNKPVKPVPWAKAPGKLPAVSQPGLPPVPQPPHTRRDTHQRHSRRATTAAWRKPRHSAERPGRQSWLQYHRKVARCDDRRRVITKGREQAEQLAIRPPRIPCAVRQPRRHAGRT